MAAVGLDVLLDFLDETDIPEHCEQDGLRTPRIDEVLQKYKEPYSVTKEPAAAATQNDHTSNNVCDDRLLVIEKQLAELLEKNQNMKNHNVKVSSNSTKRQQLSRGIRGVSPVTNESDHSTSPQKNIREKRKRVGIKYSGKESTKTATFNNSKDMEQERERRWKAEQAAVKLAEHVRTLQIQVHQQQHKHDLNTVQSSKLESSLVKERDKHLKVKQEKENLQISRSEIVKELEVLKIKCHEQMCLLRDLENQLEKLERERMQCNQKLRDAEILSATNEREATLNEQLATRRQQQIHDLQELLATREREHMKELDRLKPVGNLDLRSLVEKEVEKERMRTESLVTQYKERLEHQMKSYRDLEEEFRTALRIEAARYQQLEQSYEKMANEFVACQESLETLKEKEAKSTNLVNELTMIVKEQKGRIIELSSGRQELLRELREKTKALQEESKARCKTEERATITQEENNRLSAKLGAHESVITGLREERKLWGHELALQGASLAQDRGKMEGQIESLNRELKELKDKLEHSNSSLRVKDKVIENETQTIKSLKEQINHHKTELASLQSEWSNRLNSLQNRYDQEKLGCQELQDQLDMMADDKMSYENRLRETEEKEMVWKEKYRALKGQWEERVLLITSLEQSVHQLQEKGKQRHQQIEHERDKAVQEAIESKKQIAHMKKYHKEQLLIQETTMNKRLEDAVKEKEREILLARRRVEDMEKEMRALLEDTAKERKTMEDKFQRLSRTFHELQKELT